MPEVDVAAMVREFITLFAVINPIGSTTVYLFVIQFVPPHLHRQFALRAVAIAAIVLLAFLVVGQFLLAALGFRPGSLQVAGGIVLFLFAMTMIFDPSNPTREIEKAEHDHRSGAVFPLAMSSIASTAAMLAIVILTDNDITLHSAPTVTPVLLVAVFLLTLILLFTATAIHRVIGSIGASVISQIMGIVLALIAVDVVLQGFDTLVALEIDGMGALSAEG